MQPRAPLTPRSLPQPSAASLLRSLRRRWAAALGFGLAATFVLSAAVCTLVPQHYTATASLQAASAQVLKTQAPRLRSREVLSRAFEDNQVRRLGVSRRFAGTAAALRWVDQGLKIDIEGEESFLNLSLSGPRPVELAALVNAVARGHLDLSDGQENARHRELVAQAQARAEAARKSLAQKTSARQFLLQGQTTPDAAALARQLTETRKQLEQVNSLLDSARARLAAHQAAKPTIDPAVVSEAAVTAELQADPAARENLALLAGLRKLLDRMRAEGHPETESSYRQTRQQFDQVQRALDGRRSALRKQLLERQRETAEGEDRTAARQLTQAVSPLEEQQKQLAQRVEVLVRAADAAHARAVRADQLGKEIEQEQQQAAAALQQLRELRAREEAGPSLTLRHEAALESIPSPLRLTLLALAPLLGLGGAALLVASLEFRARRIHSADEVAAGLGVRVLGAVPALPGTQKQRCLIVEEPLNEHGLHGAESIDGIRAALLRDAGAGPRVVMVTSAVAGEGKTTLSSNLALSLARAGRRTLLVDCDLRRPAAHQLFEQALQPGLGEVLLAEVPLADALRPTTTDANLWLLPAGQWDRELPLLLARGLAEAVFERLREQFDFVVVDSHPLLAAADSLLVGQHADAVLLAVMRGLSQAPRVSEVCRRLENLGIRVLGAVVSNAPVEDLGDGNSPQTAARR